ncbi:hypothetical protein [Clostridium disporicum]|uniref:hypothetical protein n=1 Tax=Clostridium disporicum TaxID=84024 RepID=UPI0034A0D72F
MFKMKLKLKLVEIKKKTNSKVFKDLKVGDEVLLSATLSNCPGYSKQLTVTNLQTGEKDTKYFTDISKIFERLEFEEVN